MHLLRSSNVKFYEAVWDTAKRSKGVIGFTQRFFWNERRASKKESTVDQESARQTNVNHAAMQRNKTGALVDIVADDGQEWIKVSTVNERRLIWDLARQGWNPADDDDTESEDEQETDSDIGILRMAQTLHRASQHTRVRYKHPRIHIVLTNMKQPLSSHISNLLDRVKRISPNIILSLGDSAFLTTPTPPLNTALESLVTDPYASLTPVLNVDCTILLALVSDLSHMTVVREGWFHRATIRQLEVEAAEALLPNTLYPAMQGRELVCTEEAAIRMREIVSTIATESEKRRAHLLLSDSALVASDPPSDGVSSTKDTVEEWQKLSEYPLPKDLSLPIRVISAEQATVYPTLIDTAVAETVCNELSILNQSVFLCGWRAGTTTLTSNRTVAKQIDSIIDDALDLKSSSSISEQRRAEDEDPEEFIGPKLWLCATSRSLIGKEKSRK